MPGFHRRFYTRPHLTLAVHLIVFLAGVPEEEPATDPVHQELLIIARRVCSP
jgi:hypothetical protein